MSETNDTGLAAMRNLSPRRNTTEAENVDQLVAEQLVHFGINPATDHGRALASIAHRLYEAGADAEALWRLTQQSIGSLDRSDRIPTSTPRSSFRFKRRSCSIKGPYAVFDKGAFPDCRRESLQC